MPPQSKYPPAEPAHEINMRAIARVEAGDHASEHAGIGRFQIAGQKRHPRAQQRTLGEGLEHMHMGMAAAEQHDIGGDRDVAVHGESRAGQPPPVAVALRGPDPVDILASLKNQAHRALR